MSLYIDTLADYKDSVVIVTAGRSGDSGPTKKGSIGSIKGVLIDENLEMSMSSDLQPTSANLVDTAKKSALNNFGGIAGEAIANRSLSILSTSDVWRGGSKFAFSVSFNVFKTNKEGVGTFTSYSKMMTYLSKLTQSKEDGKTILGLKRPVFYDVDAFEASIAKSELKKLQGELFTVTIGTWFKSTLLLPVSVNANYSTHTDKTGSPIYCTVTIAFQTFRELTNKEYAKIITK